MVAMIQDTYIYTQGVILPLCGAHCDCTGLDELENEEEQEAKRTSMAQKARRLT